VRQGLLMSLRAGADYVGFWDADLATPLVDIEPFCRILDGKPQIDAVIGTRMRLLGHAIDRRPLRYVLGRLFANVASIALGVRLFDTQCGAKLFRTSPELATLLAEPFSTRWIFDVEMFARIKRSRRGTERPPLVHSIYEFPLDAWRDVAGSNVKGRDFAKASWELARIYWRYLRPGAPPLPALSPSDSQFPLPAAPRGDQKAA
jgi:dolichyl-phosphate beta-glucosyltransferase